MQALMRRALVAGLALLGVLGAPQVSAQRSDLTALQDRLDPASFRALAALVDSARVEGLPTAPLVSKAQEGLLKRASPTAILVATRSLVGRLRQAREALGTLADVAELEAGASALKAGAGPDQLTAVRASRGGQSVTVPLVVMADLLARGVPRDTAVRALQALAAAHATDAAFTALRLGIEKDISGGMSPGSAAGARYRAILGRQP